MGLVDNDVGLGIVFVGMFSIGILIVSVKFCNMYFYVDCIIDGNFVLVVLDWLEIGDFDLGFCLWVVMSVVLFIVVFFIMLVYKELKIGIFDLVLVSRFGLKLVLF